MLIGFFLWQLIQKRHLSLVTLEALRQIAERLAQSEKRYSTLFHESQVSMFIIDPETGVIENANKKATEFYGYAYDRLLGMKISEINVLPPEQTPEKMASEAKREKKKFEFQHQTAS